MDILHHKFYEMSEGVPIDHTNGQPMRSASFHPVIFGTNLLKIRGDFDSMGNLWGSDYSWWGDEVLSFAPIVDHQNVPKDAQRVLAAMLGACMFNIGEMVPHPHAPEDAARMLLNRLEIILFIWGRAGTGKSTLLKIISMIYGYDLDIVGILENESSQRFGLEKVKGSYVIVCPDIDANFNLAPTQLTCMTSGTVLILITGSVKADVVFKKGFVNALQAHRWMLFIVLHAFVVASADMTICDVD